VRFEVLAVMSIKVAVSLDVVACSLWIGTDFPEKPAASIFYPEDGDSKCLSAYMTSHPRRLIFKFHFDLYWLPVISEA
jgi:hypothetical protein